MLAEKLGDAGYEVIAFDPSIVAGNASPRKIKMASSAEECVDMSEVCILATPWKEFSKIPEEKFAGKIIVDLWRTFQGEGVLQKYIAIGKDSGSEFPAEYIASLGGFQEKQAVASH
jgi:predicted dinucleotide-binding enzyme